MSGGGSPAFPLSPMERADLAQALVRDTRIRPSSRAVGIALIGFVNGISGRCYPSYAKLAASACLKRRATINAIKDLELHGWLTVQRVSGGDPDQDHGWTTNQFVLHPPVHVDAPGPGAPACTTPVHGGAPPPVHDGAPPPVHVDAPPPVHRRAPKLSDRELSDRNSEETLSSAAPKSRSPKPGNSETEIDAAFADWWGRYPKRAGMLGARKQFARTLRAGLAKADELNAGADRYAAQCRSARTEPRYVKSPEVWLNKGCWADEPAATAPPNSSHRQEAGNGWAGVNFGSRSQRQEAGPILEGSYEIVR